MESHVKTGIFASKRFAMIVSSIQCDNHRLFSLINNKGMFWQGGVGNTRQFNKKMKLNFCSLPSTTYQTCTKKTFLKVG